MLGWFLQIWAIINLIPTLIIIFVPVPEQSAPEVLQEQHLEAVRSLNAYAILYPTLLLMLGRWLVKKDKTKVEQSSDPA